MLLVTVSFPVLIVCYVGCSHQLASECSNCYYLFFRFLSNSLACSELKETHILFALHHCQYLLKVKTHITDSNSLFTTYFVCATVFEAFSGNLIEENKYFFPYFRTKETRQQNLKRYAQKIGHMILADRNGRF